jgi:hypothetical protein
VSTKEIQTEPVVRDDLTPYQGSWVAIRDGKVIAHDLDPIRLRDNEEVRETDFFLLVPSEATELLIL